MARAGSRRLGQTTAAMAALRRRLADGAGQPTAEDQRLEEVRGFGANPGRLRMLAHAPAGLDAGAPLVVALHGCTQTAQGYIAGAGWLTLAERLGFVLVCPEQRPENNQNLCFNWFQPGDVGRGQGEAESIREMVAHAAERWRLDQRRVFVAGLSAGAAMAAAMLATYPEVFAGGGIVAGLPYRAAETMHDAFNCMFQAPSRTPREWGDLVRSASAHSGPWPRVSIWQGGADATVIPANARELIKQWTDVHGLDARANLIEHGAGHTRETWSRADGEVQVEAYTIAAMGHGTPIGGADGVGAPGPHVFNVGLGSSAHIAAFWGLGEAAGAPLAVTPPDHARPFDDTAFAAAGHTAALGNRLAHGVDVERTIYDALRAAGLLKR